MLDKELPVNHAILGNLQDVFNLLPNLSTPTPKGDAKSTGAGELGYAMGIKTNDQLMAIYLSSLIRAITAFHDLIENKVQNKQHHEDKEKEMNEEKTKKDAKENGKDTKETKEGDKEKEKEKEKDRKKK